MTTLPQSSCCTPRNCGCTVVNLDDLIQQIINQTTFENLTVNNLTVNNSLTYLTEILQQSFTQGFYNVPTFGDMRLIVTKDYNKVCLTNGLLVEADGQGAIYYWDVNSTATDDGIDVGKPDDVDVADPGRWLRWA